MTEPTPTTTTPAMHTMQPSADGKRLISRRVLSAFGIGLLILFALIETVPFVMTISNSFKCLPATRQVPEAFVPISGFIDCQNDEGSQLAATATTDGLAFNPTLEGYEEIMQFQFPRWFLNSVIYATAVTLLRLILDSLAGYALARMNFPGKRMSFFVILGTMMIPAVVLLIPRFIILGELGLLNTYQGVVLSLAADAFGVFLMKQFFESIPDEIEEAAMVDGANRLILFFRIVLPMATPALTALTIFSFQGTWNNFMDLLIIVNSEPDLHNLPLGLAGLRGQYGDTLEWNTFLAGSVFTTLPMAILFFIFQRYFVEVVSYSGPYTMIFQTIWVAAGIVWMGILLYTWPIYYEMEHPDLWGATWNAAVMVFINPVFTLVLILCTSIIVVLSIIFIAAWALLTWGAIAALSNAAAINRLDAYRRMREVEYLH